ncbi:phage virion morphogenesis protein [Dysgonomonas termitidis]|uniref:Phage virion morphogenesis protein n=1 Tax=Dysgonomonas termitidis TaxID=1516126 RepID=A0ABV9KYP7_9BACT
MASIREAQEYVRIFNRIESAVRAIPARVAVLAVNFSKERFIKKNWIDRSVEGWPKTKKKKGSTLVASGRLKQSIRKVSVTPSRVVIGTNVPYARIHNEGGEISGTERVRSFVRKSHRRRSHTRKGKRIKATTVKEYRVKSFSREYHRKFIRRQFIGQSQELGNRISKLIQSEIDKAIRGL